MGVYRIDGPILEFEIRVITLIMHKRKNFPHDGTEFDYPGAGLAGHAVANRATGIYASYLEDDHKWQIDFYKSAISRAWASLPCHPSPILSSEMACISFTQTADSTR